MHAFPCRSQVPRVGQLAGWFVPWLICATMLCPAPAQAGPSAPLRVRGKASLAATTRARGDALEVRGTVSDDAGRPLADAIVTLGLKTPSGGAAALPLPDTCTPSPAVERLLGSANRYAITTDSSGAFCVRAKVDASDGVVRLGYEDPDGLYEPTELELPIDRKRHSLVLGFAPEPGFFDLSQPAMTLFVDTRLRRTAPPPAPDRDTAAVPERGAQPSDENILLTLLLEERSGKRHKLGKVRIRAGERAQFDVKSSDLGAPGPGFLVVRFEGSEDIQPAERRVVVTRRARVELSLPEEGRTRSADGTTLAVGVGYSGGAVPRGSVEARVNGRTVGISPVADGAATLRLRVESTRQRVARVSLHYVPDAPWWSAGSPLETTVTTVQPSSWARVLWTLTAGLVVVWLVLAWRRPRRRAPDAPKLPRRPPGRASVEVIEDGDHSPVSGWVGVVLDAHEGTPIAGARVRIFAPAFDAPSVLSETLSGTDGHFELETLQTSRPEGASLRVTARWYSSLEHPLPAEGQVRIHLTSVRRALLDRLVSWAGRRGPTYVRNRPGPTPGEVVDLAVDHQDNAVANWARDVERAAYGPIAPDSETESEIGRREPK